MLKKHGGESGIRTHGTLTRTLVFKTSAFDHSAISPNIFYISKPIQYIIKEKSYKFCIFLNVFTIINVIIKYACL